MGNESDISQEITFSFHKLNPFIIDENIFPLKNFKITLICKIKSRAEMQSIIF